MVAGETRKVQGDAIGNEWSLTYQKPFKGTYTEKITIVGSENETAIIKHYTKSSDSNEIIKEGTLHKNDSNDLLAGIDALRGFPSDNDKDIYGLDVKIEATSSDIQFSNAEAMTDTRVCEQENKDTFATFVQQLEAMARQHAKKETAI